MLSTEQNCSHLYKIYGDIPPFQINTRKAETYSTKVLIMRYIFLNFISYYE